MTIVNVLKIPNQIQFGLEKSLTIDIVDDYASYTSYTIIIGWWIHQLFQ